MVRTFLLSTLFLASTAWAGTPGRVAITVGVGGALEDLTDLSHTHEMGPSPSISAAVEVFNKRHWLSLQASFAYGHNTMTDHTYMEYAVLDTYTPSVMLKVKPIRSVDWLWAGVRLGAVKVDFSDTSWTQGPGQAESWGAIAQGNVILVIAQHRHLAVSLESGYQFATLKDVTYTRRRYYDGPISYPIDFELSGPRVALGVSWFP